MPLKYGSTSASTAFAAIAASTALPPCSSTCTPARAASGWLAATMPYFVATFDRPTTTKGAEDRAGGEVFRCPMRVGLVTAPTRAIDTSAERMLMDGSPRERYYLVNW